MSERAEQQADRWPATMRLDTAAAYLDLSRMSFLRWVETGLVSGGKKIGGIRLWDRRELDLLRNRIFDAGGVAPEESADERERRWKENKARKEAARGRHDQGIQLRP